MTRPTFPNKIDVFWSPWSGHRPIGFIDRPPTAEFRKSECAKRKFALRAFVFGGFQCLRTPQNGLNGQFRRLRRAFLPSASPDSSYALLPKDLPLKSHRPKKRHAPAKNINPAPVASKSIQHKIQGILFFKCDF